MKNLVDSVDNSMFHVEREATLMLFVAMFHVERPKEFPTLPTADQLSRASQADVKIRHSSHNCTQYQRHQNNWVARALELGADCPTIY